MKTTMSKETEDQIIKRLAETKTEEQLLDIKSRLEADLIIAPPGKYYGQLCLGIMRVMRTLDLQKSMKREKELET